MKAILLDPESRSITEVEHDGDFRDIQRLISAAPFDVRPLHGYEGESIYFDDEFLLRDKAHDYQTYQDIDGLPDPIGGKALILGVTIDGSSCDTKLTVEDVERMVSYRRMKVIGWSPTETERHGGINIIRGPRPLFDIDPTPGKKRDPETVVSDDEFYKSTELARAQLVEYMRDFLRKGKTYYDTED